MRAQKCPNMAENTRIRVQDTYLAFIAQMHHSSGIPMPRLLHFLRNWLATRGRTCSSSHFGEVMKDRSQQDHEDPYSPLLCILLLLAIGAATQLKIHSVWF
jgi:hypothetical protein